MYRKVNGFTLIEMMVVVAIIGILAAIALPNYSKYMDKSRRAEGKVALLALQQAQAKLRANCPFYAQVLIDDDLDAVNDSSCLASNTTELEFATTTESGFYVIDITAGTASGNSYTATADGSGSVQSNDTGCTILTLTVEPENPNGIRTPADCW